MLPVAITLVVIGRQIIGIKGFSITAPILIGFAFAATGLQAGVMMYLAALGAGFIIRLALSGVRLLYLPKMALTLLGVIIATAAVINFLPYKENIQFPLAAFSFIILILSVEQFTSFLIEQGPRKTFGVALETLAMSVVIFFLLTWGWLQGLVLAYPVYIIAAIIILNLFLGRWTGLRFSEYIRFKDIIFK